MINKGRSHKTQGIKKKPSESVYPADILSDINFQACTGLARGAWLQCLLPIWHNDTDRVTGTLDSFSRQWGMTLEETETVLAEFILHKPCDVYLDNEKQEDCNNFPLSRSVTEKSHQCHAIVTLVNRRRERAIKDRNQAKKRKDKQRGKDVSQECHTDFTSKMMLSSISSSISSSPSGGKSPQVQVFLSELNQQLSALDRLISMTDSGRQNPESKKKASAYRKQRKDLLEQIANYNTNPNGKEDHENQDRKGKTGEAA